jgi:hypothetical protein
MTPAMLPVCAPATASDRFLCVNHYINSPSSTERCQGFADGLGVELGNQMIDSGTGPGRNQEPVLAYLNANPDTDAVLTLGPTSADPTILALGGKRHGRRHLLRHLRPGRQHRAGIKDGVIKWGIDQQPFLQAYLPVVVLTNYHRYGVLPGNNINSGPGFVTADGSKWSSSSRANTAKISSQGGRLRGAAPFFRRATESGRGWPCPIQDNGTGRPGDERIKEISPPQGADPPRTGRHCRHHRGVHFFSLFAGDSGMFNAQGHLNWSTVSAQFMIIAVGACLLMIAGEFDLSVGSMIGFAGMMIAIFRVTLQWPVWIAIILTFALCIAIGALNGVIVVRPGCRASS